MYDAVYPLVAYGAFATDCVVHATGGALDSHGTHTRETITGGPGQPPSPGFNRPASGDYRLRSESFLTDYCDAVAYAPTTRDIVLTPRCQNDRQKPGPVFTRRLSCGAIPLPRLGKICGNLLFSVEAPAELLYFRAKEPRFS